MPIIIPKSLPANKILQEEEVFVIHEERAVTQDIRPLKCGILNLMPLKIETETQLLRLISNTPLQVEIDFIRPMSHKSKNTSQDHLEKFYIDFDEMKEKRYDCFIVTGAPVEHFEFEEVNYWQELTKFFEFFKTNVFSTMFICWGVQAALKYYYNIEKYVYSEKLFGVYETNLLKERMLTKGISDIFHIPHSRYTYTKEEDLKKISDLEILAGSEETGPSIFQTKDSRMIFLTGHGEYDTKTLDGEYWRDLKKGLDIQKPVNYYKDNDPSKGIINLWKSHYNLLFFNWLNHYVYQLTPYDLEELEEKII